MPEGSTSSTEASRRSRASRARWACRPPLERRTLDRLRQDASLNRLQESDREGLEEAFRLLWQVRLEHQVRQVRQGQAPNDYIDPKELGSVTRQGVKAAFRVIDAVQRTLALEFDLHRA
jgi:CBS domain-containing protein